MIVDYRAADPEREMFLSYTGKPMSASECCPHTDIDTVKGWAEFCRHVQKLRLNPEEHALMLAISMTFQGRTPFFSLCGKFSASLINLSLDNTVSVINIVNEERIYVNMPSIYTYINLFYQKGTLKKRYVSQSENSLDVQPLCPNTASNL